MIGVFWLHPGPKVIDPSDITVWVMGLIRTDYELVTRDKDLCKGIVMYNLTADEISNLQIKFNK